MFTFTFNKEHGHVVGHQNHLIALSPVPPNNKVNIRHKNEKCDNETPAVGVTNAMEAIR